MATVSLDTKPGTSNQRHAVGDLMLVHGTYNGPASYVAGGDPITAADLGFTTAHTIAELDISLDQAVSRFAAFDKTNGKIKIFTALGAEAAGASNQSAIAFRFIALIA
jgi:hypothetical protein